MVLQKPLKTFLSYSHDDDRDKSLFREFRKQLKSLEDDKLIDVWWDKEILPGRRWDNEIQTNLQACQLFLAFTSASFNSSEYIAQHELPSALARTNECLVVPVLWRKWRVPQSSPLTRLQWLNWDQPVHGAPDVDALFACMIEKLAAAIEEGRPIAGQQPKAAPPSATAPIPLALPYLCDWTNPIAQLQTLRPAAARRPSLLVVTSRREDCAGDFLERIHREELPKALGHAAGTPVHDRIIADWPEEAGQIPAFLYEVRPDAACPIEKRLREGLTVVQANTSWDAAKEGVLLALAAELQGAEWALPATRNLVVAVSVRSDDPAALAAQLRTALNQNGTAAVVALPEIHLDHARTWTSHPEVRRRCRPGSHSEMEHRVEAHYEGATVMPMARLAPKLLALLEEYREKGNAT